jgi:hypothetical protein
MLPYFTAPFKGLRAALPWCRPLPPPAPPSDDPCPLIHPLAPLPAWVENDPLVQEYRALLGELPWQQFPSGRLTAPGPAPRPSRARLSSPPSCSSCTKASAL